MLFRSSLMITNRSARIPLRCSQANNLSSSSRRQPCHYRNQSRRGVATIMIALLLPVILGMVGVAFDMGNMYLAHTRLQSAVDAGALAGSLELPYDPDLSKGIVSAAVAYMVALNMESAEIESVTPGTEVRSVVVQGKAKVNLMLMDLAGMTRSEERRVGKECRL